ncbi:hypothetical protein Pcinc_044030 [Petrolisthes cinctipes]|uniref:Uncharacterized protein n=1 Tax=Petrolisthes cinctipes TaxID=88211 RepID=A0AAE1BEF0_PETCI|nr:hypothetical protein Pcinc_044030 [Petrolisthes cinctipes]
MEVEVKEKVEAESKVCVEVYADRYGKLKEGRRRCRLLGKTSTFVRDGKDTTKVSTHIRVKTSGRAPRIRMCICLCFIRRRDQVFTIQSAVNLCSHIQLYAFLLVIFEHKHHTSHNSLLQLPFPNSPFDNSHSTTLFYNSLPQLPFHNSPSTIPLLQLPSHNSLPQLPYHNSPSTTPILQLSSTTPFLNSPSTIPLLQLPSTIPFHNSPSTTTLLKPPSLIPLLQLPSSTPLPQLPLPQLPFLNFLSSSPLPQLTFHPNHPNLSGKIEDPLILTGLTLESTIVRRGDGRPHNHKCCINGPLFRNDHNQLDKSSSAARGSMQDQ